MNFVRWDDDSRTYALIAGACLVIFGYIVATSDQTYYLHMQALWGVIAGSYIALTAVVPDLRGRDGSLVRRAIATAAFWVTTSVALVLLWRAGI